MSSLPTQFSPSRDGTLPKSTVLSLNHDALRFPFYYPLKVMFVMWCLLPHYRGAAIVYTAWIQPIFIWVQDKLRTAFADLSLVVDDTISSVCLHLRASSDSA